MSPRLLAARRAWQRLRSKDRAHFLLYLREEADSIDAGDDALTEENTPGGAAANRRAVRLIEAVASGAPAELRAARRAWSRVAKQARADLIAWMRSDAEDHRTEPADAYGRAWARSCDKAADLLESVR